MVKMKFTQIISKTLKLKTRLQIWILLIRRILRDRRGLIRWGRFNLVTSHKKFRNIRHHCSIFPRRKILISKKRKRKWRKENLLIIFKEWRSTSTNLKRKKLVEERIMSYFSKWCVVSQKTTNDGHSKRGTQTLITWTSRSETSTRTFRSCQERRCSRWAITRL